MNNKCAVCNLPITFDELELGISVGNMFIFSNMHEMNTPTNIHRACLDVAMQEQFSGSSEDKQD